MQESAEQVKQIAIVGGTHGNELSGLQVISAAARPALLAAAGQIPLTFVSGNPDAVAQNVRFVDVDLNRQFTFETLNSNEADSLEVKQALKLNKTLGPKHDPQFDLVIDIHNTTANMSATLILLSSDTFHVQLARYVKYHMPEANILLEDHLTREAHPYLCTLGKRGVMVEVGPQPQGVCRADCTLLAMDMTKLILAFCSQSQPNAGLENPIEAYKLGKDISLPEGEWMIHPQLQDRDFQLLTTGQPIFLTADNQVQYWDGPDTYPTLSMKLRIERQD